MTRTIKGENGSCLDVHDRRPVILPSYLWQFRIDDTAGEAAAILPAVPEVELVRVTSSGLKNDFSDLCDALCHVDCDPTVQRFLPLNYVPKRSVKAQVRLKHCIRVKADSA